MGLLGDVFKIGGSLIGGKKQKKASKKAQAALVAAGNQAIGTVTAAQDAVLPTFQPAQEAGNQALSSLRELLYGGPTAAAASPDYQFRQDEARRAIEASAAARGTLNSGATLKALLQRSQNVAAQEYDNRYRRLRDMAGFGYGATADAARIRLGTADTVADTQMDIGNAKAGGIIQRGNINAAKWQSIGNFLGDAAEGIASGGWSYLMPKSGTQPGSGRGSSYQAVQYPTTIRNQIGLGGR